MFGRASLVIVLMALACLLATPSRVTAADRHSGYYYPDPGAAEVYVSRGKQLPGVNRTTRIGFVTGLTAQQSSQPYPALTAIDRPPLLPMDCWTKSTVNQRDLPREPCLEARHGLRGQRKFRNQDYGALSCGHAVRDRLKVNLSFS